MDSYLVSYCYTITTKYFNDITVKLDKLTEDKIEELKENLSNKHKYRSPYDIKHNNIINPTITILNIIKLDKTN